jgi:hypothetical protein
MLVPACADAPTQWSTSATSRRGSSEAAGAALAGTLRRRRPDRALRPGWIEHSRAVAGTSAGGSRRRRVLADHSVRVHGPDRCRCGSPRRGGRDSTRSTARGARSPPVSATARAVGSCCVTLHTWERAQCLSRDRKCGAHPRPRSRAPAGDWASADKAAPRSLLLWRSASRPAGRRWLRRIRRPRAPDRGAPPRRGRSGAARARSSCVGRASPKKRKKKTKKKKKWRRCRRRVERGLRARPGRRRRVGARRPRDGVARAAARRAQ